MVSHQVVRHSKSETTALAGLRDECSEHPEPVVVLGALPERDTVPALSPRLDDRLEWGDSGVNGAETAC